MRARRLPVSASASPVRAIWYIASIGQPSQLVRRGFGSVRARGVTGAVRWAARPWILRVRAHERHVWYELDLRAERRRRDLPPGFILAQAEDPDLPKIAELPEAATVPTLRRLRDDGHDLWLVKHDDAVAFVCWIFRHRARVIAAKGGWIELPRGVACLEDSLTAAGLRGRGIAPGAWSAIADTLRSDGMEAMVTKVEEQNAASRTAVVKAGFREIAQMTLDREWGRSRVTVSPLAGRKTGAALAELIERST